VIFSGGQVANMGVPTDGAAFSFDQDREHGLYVGWIGRAGRRAGRNIVKLTMDSKLAAQLINARDQSFEMIAVFDAGSFGNFLESFPLSNPMRFTLKIV
jgi:hypothetical protein